MPACASSGSRPTAATCARSRRRCCAARGDVLLLADQDDEWVPGRRALLVEAAAGGGVAASNLVLLETGEPLRVAAVGQALAASAPPRRASGVRNELRILAGVAPYFGCAMAVRRDMLAAITPFPAFLTESHDLWIATVANASGRMSHVEPATVRRRIHEANASSSRPRGVRPAVAIAVDAGARMARGAAPQAAAALSLMRPGCRREDRPARVGDDCPSAAPSAWRAARSSTQLSHASAKVTTIVMRM